MYYIPTSVQNLKWNILIYSPTICGIYAWQFLKANIISFSQLPKVSFLSATVWLYFKIILTILWFLAYATNIKYLGIALKVSSKIIAGLLWDNFIPDNTDKSWKRFHDTLPRITLPAKTPWTGLNFLIYTRLQITVYMKKKNVLTHIICTLDLSRIVFVCIYIINYVCTW